MTAMFPDSGVPYTDARNSLPSPITANCNPLWYSTSRCQPRFDPAAANAVLSELLNLVNKGEVTYDCNYLNQVEMAVRFLIQRGIPCGTALTSGPFAYVGALDPAATRYNDFMTLVVVPPIKNQGAVTLDINGRGAQPVLRNDGQQLVDGDWLANTPVIISYWAGAWRMIGLCQSQVPILAVGAVDVWIRTDGNDTTGDGSENTPEKAFKTINGAWSKVGGRYASTPLFIIRMRLGIPGDYDGGNLHDFGGGVSLIGDPANKSAYRILTTEHGGNPFIASSVQVSNLKLSLEGITVLRSQAAGSITSIGLYIGGGGEIDLYNCAFDTTVANPLGVMINCQGGVWVTSSDLEFYGRGTTSQGIITMTYGAVSGGVSTTDPFKVITFDGFVSSIASFYLDNLSVQSFNSTHMVATSCTGEKYRIHANSILNMNGQTPPGDVAGSFDTGGQFIA